MSSPDPNSSTLGDPSRGAADLSAIAEACRGVVVELEEDRVVRALLQGALTLGGGEVAALLDLTGDGQSTEAILEEDGAFRLSAEGLSQAVRLPRALTAERLAASPSNDRATTFDWEGRTWLALAISARDSRNVATRALVIADPRALSVSTANRDFALNLLVSQASAALDNARRYAHYRKAEAELAQSEEKHRALYTNTPMMLHSIDTQGRLVSVSKRWLEKMGYDWMEVIGRKSVEFLTPESRSRAEEVVLPEYFKTGVCNDIPYQFVTKSGSILDIELSAIAERDAEGHIIRSFAVLEDVTDLKRAEAERRRLADLEAAARAEAKAASELNRLKGAFLASVSHELRTPLTTMWGFAELLKDEPGPPGSPGREAYALQITNGIRRLEGLLNDLLDSASIEAGTFGVRLAPGDLGTLIEEAVEYLGPLVTQRRLTVEVDLGDEPLEADLDEGRISQVLANFLGNAVKFSPPEAKIRVCARGATDNLMCEVSDSGPGIAQAAIPKLFKPFSRVETEEAIGGTGLGLSIYQAKR
jgi:PAS domain S-box-containing protein